MPSKLYRVWLEVRCSVMFRMAWGGPVARPHLVVFSVNPVALDGGQPIERLHGVEERHPVPLR